MMSKSECEYGDKNTAVLIGLKEISFFLGISPRKVQQWREQYADMPIFSERQGARLCADKAALASWQRRLFVSMVNSD